MRLQASPHVVGIYPRSCATKGKISVRATGRTDLRIPAPVLLPSRAAAHLASEGRSRTQGKKSNPSTSGPTKHRFGRARHEGTNRLNILLLKRVHKKKKRFNLATLRSITLGKCFIAKNEGILKLKKHVLSFFFFALF